jgi:hypothetical protein
VPTKADGGHLNTGVELDRCTGGHCRWFDEKLKELMMDDNQGIFGLSWAFKYLRYGGAHEINMFPTLRSHWWFPVVQAGSKYRTPGPDSPLCRYS